MADPTPSSSVFKPTETVNSVVLSLRAVSLPHRSQENIYASMTHLGGAVAPFNILGGEGQRRINFDYDLGL